MCCVVGHTHPSECLDSYACDPSVSHAAFRPSPRDCCGLHLRPVHKLLAVGTNPIEWQTHRVRTGSTLFTRTGSRRRHWRVPVPQGISGPPSSDPIPPHRAVPDVTPPAIATTTNWPTPDRFSRSTRPTSPPVDAPTSGTPWCARDLPTLLPSRSRARRPREVSPRHRRSRSPFEPEPVTRCVKLHN